MHTPWAHQMLMSSLSHVSQEWSRSNESCYSHTSQCTPLYPLISYSLWSANNNYNAVFNKNLILGLLTLAVLAYMPMCLHFYYKCCQTFLLCIALIVFNNTFFFFFLHAFGKHFSLRTEALVYILAGSNIGGISCEIN